MPCVTLSKQDTGYSLFWYQGYISTPMYQALIHTSYTWTCSVILLEYIVQLYTVEKKWLKINTDVNGNGLHWLLWQHHIQSVAGNNIHLITWNNWYKLQPIIWLQFMFNQSHCSVTMFSQLYDSTVTANHNEWMVRHYPSQIWTLHTAMALCYTDVVLYWGWRGIFSRLFLQFFIPLYLMLGGLGCWKI